MSQGGVPPLRAAQWAATMRGRAGPDGVVSAHGGSQAAAVGRRVSSREAREAAEHDALVEGATRASGAGRRARPEPPDQLRTCFERDRDRILHSAPFRRLAGKTQVFVHPRDHQRTRLTHALEVTQVATAVARALGLNTSLTEAIALGHDCGHGPGGHASEDAFTPYVPGGYDHATWGADVVLAPLNLCVETLDGIRHHSWSLPSPRTPEGQVVSWADRIAYCAHDLEDAVGAGVVDAAELPAGVAQAAGRTRAAMLRYFITAMVDCTAKTGRIGMTVAPADVLSELRAFNYERIYTLPAAADQGRAVVAVLRGLVEWYAADPERLPGAARGGEPLAAAVTYVAGMTDRFAFDTALERLGWDPARLPRSVH